jgi:hypothetical protein
MLKCYFILLLFISLCLGDIGLYLENDAEQTSTTTAMVDAANFTIPVSDGDIYKLEWTAEIHASPGAAYIRVCLVCDGMIVNEQDWHPNPDGPIAEGFAVASGWKVVVTSGLSQGKFSIKFGSSDENETVKIRRVRIFALPINAVTFAE